MKVFFRLKNDTDYLQARTMSLIFVQKGDTVHRSPNSTHSTILANPCTGDNPMVVDGIKYSAVDGVISWHDGDGLMAWPKFMGHPEDIVLPGRVGSGNYRD